jgi:dihydroflavonol-4-reductase
MAGSLSLAADAKGLLPDPAFWQGKRVAVTGAGGFLGQHLIEQLVRLRARVRVLGLPLAEEHPLRAQPIEYAVADVRDPDPVRRFLVGAEVVFHIPSAIPFPGAGPRTLPAAFRLGTRHVLAASRDARVVHSSSILAVGGSSVPVPVTEDSPLPTCTLALDGVCARRSAELLALETASRQDVVVTNPTFLLGPQDHDTTSLSRYCLGFWRGRLPVAPNGGLNVVDVRDAARGHLLAAENGRSGRRYLLGGEDGTFVTLGQALAAVAGLRPRAVVRVPRCLLGPLAAAAAARAWLQGKAPYPSPRHARMLRYYWFARSDRASQELGYCPRPLSACLADTYVWFASRCDLRPGRLGAWWARPGAPVVIATRAVVEAPLPVPRREPPLPGLPAEEVPAPVGGGSVPR